MRVAVAEQEAPAEADINHHWLPPGVYHAEAYDGTPRRELTSDIAFVGSWRGYAHDQHWPARQAMLDRVAKRYGKRFQRWPKKLAIRGTQLTDLYASVKVVIGDSCLAGQVPGYWSDRVPETTGRGGLLIHPNVERLTEVHPYLPIYTPGDLDELCTLIDFYLEDDEAREQTRKACAEDTRLNHTYRNRVTTILETVL